jgi:uncharacterized protein YukE
MHSGQIKVPIEHLHEAAQAFHKASHDTSDLEDELNKTTHRLIQEMSTVLKFSPGALQRLHDRWSGEIKGLGDAQESVSTNLQKAVNNFREIDNSAIPPTKNV